MTTSGANWDDKVGIIATLGFRPSLRRVYFELRFARQDYSAWYCAIRIVALEFGKLTALFVILFCLHKQFSELPNSISSVLSITWFSPLECGGEDVHTFGHSQPGILIIVRGTIVCRCLYFISSTHGGYLISQNNNIMMYVCICVGFAPTGFVLFLYACWAPSQYKDRLIYVWRFPC